MTPPEPASPGPISVSAKIDLSRLHPDYFKAAKNAALLSFPPFPYLAISGAGTPASPVFQIAVAALYRVAYSLKFNKKFQLGIDYKVASLEGLWWAEDAACVCADPTSYHSIPRESWRWKLLIMLPDFITPADVAQVRRHLQEKQPDPTLALLQFEKLHEPSAVQVLHVGPYAAEPSSLALIRAFIADHGLTPAGRHHEIYLSDPHRTTPEKLRTILRQPVAAQPRDIHPLPLRASID